MLKKDHTSCTLIGLNDMGFYNSTTGNYSGGLGMVQSGVSTIHANYPNHVSYENNPFGRKSMHIS